MKNSSLPKLCGLTFGVVLCGLAYVDRAAAASVVYRFEAERSNVPIDPPPGSVAAAAASVESLSGTFGFETGAPVAASAENAGRVAFASYDTGFITVDGVDIGTVPGEISVQVTDGLTQSGAPGMTIADEIILASRAISTDAPIDAISVRLRFVDAERLQGVALPTVLRSEDVAGMSLTFSTRVDGMGNRAEGQAPPVEILGLVHFEIKMIERVH